MQSPSQTKSELMNDAKGIGQSAVNRLHTEIDSRKGDAVQQAAAVSSAVSRTADSLDSTAPDWLKNALQQGTQKIQQFTDTIEQKDSRQLVSQVNDFARNSPTTFLAACAATGFLAVRMFKAGSENSAQLGTVNGDDEMAESGNAAFP